jgi:hypothetical protein
VTQYHLTIYGINVSMDTDQFRCVVSNTAGSTTSSAGTLAVGIVPVITAQPVPTTGTSGQTISFSVSATGTGPLIYEWYRYGTLVGNAPTLTIPNLQSSDAGTYGVHVINAFGLAYSNNVGLTVNPAVAPTVSAPLQPVTGSVGDDVSLTITASGSAPFTYQWRKDGVPISGATTATLTLTAIQANAAGQYDVVVTNAAGSAISNAVTITVNPPPAIPPSNIVITITVS